MGREVQPGLQRQHLQPTRDGVRAGQNAGRERHRGHRGKSPGGSNGAGKRKRCLCHICWVAAERRSPLLAAAGWSGSRWRSRACPCLAANKARAVSASREPTCGLRCAGHKDCGASLTSQHAKEMSSVFALKPMPRHPKKAPISRTSLHPGFLSDRLQASVHALLQLPSTAASLEASPRCCSHCF